MFRFGLEPPPSIRKVKFSETGPIPDERIVREQAASMTGPLMQVPPAFSAVHIGGRRAYQLARQGREVDMPERPVTIHALDILTYDPPFLSVRIRCSKGTYVRSIARDLGIRCGSCAYVTELRRTASGPFRVEEAVAPEAFRAAQDVLPPESWIPRLGAIRTLTVREEHERSVLHGIPLSGSFFTSNPPEEEGLYALFGMENRFLASRSGMAAAILSLRASRGGAGDD